MKIIFNLTLILAVVISAGIGCLIIFEVFEFEQGLDYILKALAAIVLLGVSSAAVTFMTVNNKPDE